MTKEYFFNDKRFKIIAALLMIIFLVFMAFLYLKAEEITRDPCSICASRMQEPIVCTIGGHKTITKTFYPDWTTVTSSWSDTLNIP